jgi:hypothetical protein
MKTHLIATIAFVVMLALPAALYAQETNPMSVVEAWNDAMNAGDADAALASLADDAFIKLVPPPIEGHDGIFRGKGEIRTWWEGLYALNGASTLSNCQGDGETVTCNLTYTDDQLQSIGVASIDNEFVVIVRDGKIHTGRHGRLAGERWRCLPHLRFGNGAWWSGNRGRHWLAVATPAFAPTAIIQAGKAA